MGPDMMARMEALMGAMQGGRESGAAGTRGSGSFPLGQAARVPMGQAQMRPQPGMWWGTEYPGSIPGAATAVKSEPPLEGGYHGPMPRHPGGDPAIADFLTAMEQWCRSGRFGPDPATMSPGGTGIPTGAGGIVPNAAPARSESGRSGGSKCPECRHRHCRCPSSSSSSSGSSSSDSDGSSRRSRRGKKVPARAAKGSGHVLKAERTLGVELPTRAASVPWKVKATRFGERTVPYYLQEAHDGHNGSIKALLGAVKPLGTKAQGTGSWTSKERMDLAVNLCFMLDTAVKELGREAVLDLACMEYAGRMVEALLMVENEPGPGGWSGGAAYLLPVVEGGSKRSEAYRKAMKDAKRDREAKGLAKQAPEGGASKK